MDFFYENIQVTKKRRVHFHEWMLEVHSRLHDLRRTDVKREVTDPVAYVTEQMLSQCWLLCLDEFQVTDVADALLLRRLFTAMFEKGAVVVATSNRPPEDLYKNGLQRKLFLPFIDLIIERCQVHSLMASKTDYRMIKVKQKVKPLHEKNDISIHRLKQSPKICICFL